MLSKRTPVPCEICGKISMVPPSLFGKRRFCSTLHQGEDVRRRRRAELERQLGEPLRDVLYRMHHIDGIGLAAIAKRLQIGTVSVRVWFNELGIRRHTKGEAQSLKWRDAAFRERMPVTRHGPDNPSYGRFGPLSASWRGGDNHPKDRRGRGWRSIRAQARRRDGECCWNCSGTHRLEVHHIVPWNLTHDNSLENLITLCYDCHTDVERQMASEAGLDFPRGRRIFGW